MNSSSSYDVIVIDLGAIGSACAYQLWHELNADTGLPVIKQTGWIGVHPQSFWSGRAIGSEYSLMTARETHDRYPMMKVPDGFAGAFDPEGAVLRPRMGVAAHCRAALERGGDSARSREGHLVVGDDLRRESAHQSGELRGRSTRPVCRDGNSQACSRSGRSSRYAADCCGMVLA